MGSGYGTPAACTHETGGKVVGCHDMVVLQYLRQPPVQFNPGGGQGGTRG